MIYKGYKKIILKYLKDLRDNSPDGAYPYGGWVLAGKIRSIDTPYGFIGFRGDRDIRDLVKAGCLETGYEGRLRIVRFKYPEPPKVGEARVEELSQLGVF